MWRESIEGEFILFAYSVYVSVNHSNHRFQHRRKRLTWEKGYLRISSSSIGPRERKKFWMAGFDKSPRFEERQMKENGLWKHSRVELSSWRFCEKNIEIFFSSTNLDNHVSPFIVCFEMVKVKAERHQRFNKNRTVTDDFKSLNAGSMFSAFC